jgi:pimeloyl-ACP methyl ester carboxylesterase
MDTSITVTANKTPTFAYCEGSGPPAVLLHGWAATAECWRPTFDELVTDHRAIAPDLPGHGRTKGGFRLYTMKYYLRWLEDLLDALDVQRAVLLGNSLGGAISVMYTLAHPERVERLVLVDALGISGKFPWGTAGRVVRRAHHLMAASALRRPDPYLLRYLDKMVFYDPWGEANPGINEMLTLNVRRGIWPGWSGLQAVVGDFLFPSQRQAFVKRLGEIDIPTLIAWGRHDGLIPVQDAFDGLAAMPCARAVIFEKSAHLPMMEEPEAFNTVLRAFLTSEC